MVGFQLRYRVRARGSEASIPDARLAPIDRPFVQPPPPVSTSRSQKWLTAMICWYDLSAGVLAYVAKLRYPGTMSMPGVRDLSQ